MEVRCRASVARQAHNLEVVGSIPASAMATRRPPGPDPGWPSSFRTASNSSRPESVPPPFETGRGACPGRIARSTAASDHAAGVEIQGPGEGAMPAIRFESKGGRALRPRGRGKSSPPRRSPGPGARMDDDPGITQARPVRFETTTAIRDQVRVAVGSPLRWQESNLLPPGYEPGELPMLYSARPM